MVKPNKARLIKAAIAARKNAVAPYSQFRVGAALLTEDGKIISGANVESVSYGLTCCAERIALFKALTDGKKSFRAIAIVAALENGPMPCGACRQLLAEYAAEAVVWVVDTRVPKRIGEFTVRELLPGAFSAFPRNSD
ncbi:MAG TPA: cytidine deaminase [Verrucomicrobiae bacterium]|jgi:cytidine deaminase